VVATAVGGTPEVIEDGESGFLVPPGDAAKMAESICVSLDNAAELPEMGCKGRMCVQEKFGFTMQAHLYRQLFAKLCPEAADDSPTDDPVDSPEDTAKPATMPAIDLDDDLLPTESTCNT
jgi:hypothetical protein